MARVRGHDRYLLIDLRLDSGGMENRKHTSIANSILWKHSSHIRRHSSIAGTSMNQTSTKAIAIDLGGSHASIALMNDNKMLALREIDIKATDGLAPLLPRLEEIVLEILRASGLKVQDCLGVSLSIPSVVDFENTRVVSANDKYSDGPSLNLSDWCDSAFHLPIVLENDARASLMGEHASGAASGFADVLMLTLGTGIGCAVFANGQPYRTSQAQGGNLGGHVVVSLNGRACTCGAIGCMESEASTWALAYVVKEWPRIESSTLSKEAVVNYKILFDHAAQGDEIARNVLERCIRVWCAGIVGLIHCYGPEIVVLGGGVMQSAARILPPVREYVSRYAWTPSGKVKIQAAQLGNQAALYAALPLLKAKLHAT
jgi:glucokinase